MQRVTGWAVVGFLMAGLVSCGGDDAKSGPSKESLTAMLQSVPDTPTVRGQAVFYGNLARIRDGKRAGSASDDVSLLLERSDGEVFLPTAIQSGILQPDFAKYAGFDSRTILSTLEYGAMPDPVGVLVGSFKIDKIGSALRKSPGGDDLGTAEKRGVTRYSLGEQGAIDPQNRSAIRPIGEALEVVVDGSTLLWSRSADAIDECLATRADGTSLGADEGYAAVAEALDGAKVTSAALVSPGQGEGWLVAGLGEYFKEAPDGYSSTVVVALHYADEKAAKAALELFTAHVANDSSSVHSTPWADTLHLEDAVVKGTTVVATFTSNASGLARRVVLEQDNLLQFG